ncbi:MAG: hypothetical protein LPK02_01115 [Rhodobacterales bacterium]|nr:hypothetical protein [Rhodobacterales bacterium]MDX5411633.1 hypothetical protein [Rhodobacterales bacterium]
MVGLLGVILAGGLILAWRPLWSGGAFGKGLYMAAVLAAGALILLLVIERIEAMGGYE